MAPVTEFKLVRAGDFALVTIDNGEDWTKPTFFGEQALESLDRLLGELEGADYRAAVITGKPFFFAAGADITEFPDITRDRAIEGARAGHELFGRLRALPFPTVAAINGACLGGGLELALHCTARTVSTAVRHFAFPEVFLGLFPAWGGTQLLPRLVGPETAIKVIVSNPLRQNRMLTGSQVAELGIADRLLEPVEFVDESLVFASELAAQPLERPAPDWSEAETLFRRARTNVDDTVHGAAPAPYTALDLIEGAETWTVEEGYSRERDAIGELLPGPQAQASIYAFGLVEQRAKKHPARPTVTPVRVAKVGVVGAGLMARQIATLFLRRLELPIVIRDVKQQIVDEALADIRAEVDGQVAKGRYDEGKGRFLASLVSGRTDYEGFADCDLVLEAVFEELELKKQVFAELEEVVGDECVLATNTSALSITDMAADLRHPERVVGMHFFNPVHIMDLLEIIRGARTSDASIERAKAFGERLGKTCIVVKDTPGFATSRLGLALGLEAMRMLEDGVAGPEDIDTAMTLGYRHPIGPLKLTDLVGLDVRLAIALHLARTLGDRFEPPQILRKLVSEGKLGKKAGQGFYAWRKS